MSTLHPVSFFVSFTCLSAASELSGEVVTGPTPEAKISFLLPDTIYGFIVSSYSVGGESEPSEELLVQTLPAGGSSSGATSLVSLADLLRSPV